MILSDVLHCTVPPLRASPRYKTPGSLRGTQAFFLLSQSRWGDLETSIAVWATSGNKAAEQMLLGSIIECVDPGSKNVTYYTTATSGDLVSGASNQEKLSLHKNSGTGATIKKTGAEVAAMGIRRIALGVLTHGQHAGANAPSVVIGGLPVTLSPIASDPFKQLAVSINDSDVQAMNIEEAL